MIRDITVTGNRQLGRLANGAVPSLILDAGNDAWRRYVEWLAANIRNRNTREAYARAIRRFSNWCEQHKVGLKALSPFLVAAYIEQLGTEASAPTVKQHLAAIRMLCDWLVVGQILPMNPAASVRGPKHVVKRGKTPVLTPDQAKLLLDSIETDTIVGLRDRALIATMIYSFARVSAVLGMNIEDHYADGKRWWIRLHEKGGKFHEVPAHHRLDEFLDVYLASSRIGADRRSPLFRSVNRHRQLTERRLTRREALAMVQRRCRGLPLPEAVCCHSFRATGITAYMLNGGTLEHAQQIAAHESPRTTKLYDRTRDEITLDEIERIVL
ncbi:MAG: tyrosine-type recombinase/integrase [Pirellulales bacterium]